jgi:hypothetical protein
MTGKSKKKKSIKNIAKNVIILILTLKNGLQRGMLVMALK